MLARQRNLDALRQQFHLQAEGARLIPVNDSGRILGGQDPQGAHFVHGGVMDEAK